MPKQFENKVALITGATSGIGESTAIAFSQRGAKVVLTGRRKELGDRIAAKIKKMGGEAIFVQGDVSHPEENLKMVNEAISAFGQIDFAFNNAGISGDLAPLTEQSLSSIDKVLAINVKGVLLSMQNQIRVMINHGGGAIVNNSSIAGLVGVEMLSVYCASKHAVIGMTKATALEVARQGIRVNAVCPAAIDTGMYSRAVGDNKQMRAESKAKHPIGRIGKPEEVAQAVLWLCSDEASFIVGQSIPIDGGYTIQ